MEIVIFVALGVVLTVLIVWSAVSSHKRALENLRRLAERLSMELHGADKSWFTAKPSVEGTQHGRTVRFWPYSTGSGKSRKEWIAVGVVPRKSGGLTFSIGQQGLFSKIAELFGAKEARTGDAAFDARWFLTTNEPDTLAAALVPEIRQKLDAALERGIRGSFETEDRCIRYAEMGRFANVEAVERLERQLPLLHDLADLVEACADSGRR